MKTALVHFKSRAAKEAGRALRARPGGRPVFSGQAAFTMIEIAIALGVIGFALIAIIGILPAGLNVQRDSHQDTIIGQDGPFFLEAIRNGGDGRVGSTSLDFLTNYVESITIVNVNGATVTTSIYTNDISNAGSPSYLRSGQMILGLLSTPEIYPSVYGNSVNFVTARVRALSGAATEQSGSNSVVAFRYYMNVEIVPFNASGNSVSYDSTDLADYSNNPVAFTNRLERSLEVPYIANNLYDLRLKFSWPVRPNGVAGPGRQPYRCLVSAPLRFYTNSTPTNWFFQPNTYTTNL